MARAMAPAAYPRVALCHGLRRRKGSASIATSAVKRQLRKRGLDEPGRLSPPIWPCTTRGFPCLVCYHTSGGLLPHLFTLTGESCEDVSQVFLRDATVPFRRRYNFLWHCP
jgi:hypothetical protein